MPITPHAVTGIRNRACCGLEWDTGLRRTAFVLEEKAWHWLQVPTRASTINRRIPAMRARLLHQIVEFRIPRVYGGSDSDALISESRWVRTVSWTSPSCSPSEQDGGAHLGGLRETEGRPEYQARVLAIQARCATGRDAVRLSLWAINQKPPTPSPPQAMGGFGAGRVRVVGVVWALVTVGAFTALPKRRPRTALVPPRLTRCACGVGVEVYVIRVCVRARVCATRAAPRPFQTPGATHSCPSSSQAQA